MHEEHWIAPHPLVNGHGMKTRMTDGDGIPEDIEANGGGTDGKTEAYPEHAR